MVNHYKIYTDGAYSSSRNQGGCAFIILKDDEVVVKYSKMFIDCTNNQMEMLAVIIALESIISPSKIEIVSDSMYVIGCCSKGWKRKKNIKLWERYDSAAAKHDITFTHVKGHEGDYYNELCDDLAVDASQEYINLKR